MDQQAHGNGYSRHNFEAMPELQVYAEGARHLVKWEAQLRGELKHYAAAVRSAGGCGAVQLAVRAEG